MENSGNVCGLPVAAAGKSGRFSQSELDQIEELAGSLTPIADIAALTGIDEDELRDELGNRHSPACKAYKRGKAKTARELRKADIDMALAGSPTAAVQIAEHLRKMLEDEEG